MCGLHRSKQILPKKLFPYTTLFRSRSDAVKDEVMKFKQAGAIKEVFYLEWLAKIGRAHV